MRRYLPHKMCSAVALFVLHQLEQGMHHGELSVLRGAMRCIRGHFIYLSQNNPVRAKLPAFASIFLDCSWRRGIVVPTSRLIRFDLQIRSCSGSCIYLFSVCNFLQSSSKSLLYTYYVVGTPSQNTHARAQ